MKNEELEILFQKYYNDAFLYVLSLSKNWQVSEDIVSQAFLKALTYANEVISFRAWFFTVVEICIMNIVEKRVFIKRWSCLWKMSIIA